MADIVKPDFQEAARGYPIIKKDIDGETVELVDIDSMTEAQFRKFCADTGTEWFQRMTVTI